MTVSMQNGQPTVLPWEQVSNKRGTHRGQDTWDMVGKHEHQTDTTQGKGNTQGGAPRTTPAMGRCLSRRAYVAACAARCAVGGMQCAPETASEHR